MGLSPTPLYCDNNGAIVLANDPTNHARSKHIDVCYHFIRERIEDDTVSIVRVPSHDNLADAFTKPLPHPAFLKFQALMGLQ